MKQNYILQENICNHDIPTPGSEIICIITTTTTTTVSKPLPETTTKQHLDSGVCLCAVNKVSYNYD